MFRFLLASLFSRETPAARSVKNAADAPPPACPGTGGLLHIVCVLVGVVAFAPSARPEDIRWAVALDQPADWYGTPQASRIAGFVLQYQRTEGGWPKNKDMARAPSAKDLDCSGDGAPTIDNDATTTQIRYLARVAAAQCLPESDTALRRGLEYLLAAQYPSGGWPQYFPLRPGYYQRITFNDNAMVNVLELLRDVAHGTPPFDRLPADLRGRCAGAVAKGIDCILRCQVIRNGVRTAWCAQHDETTLQPAPARTYEPVSLSGYETVAIVAFLMGVEEPGQEITEAITSAVEWLSHVEIRGIRTERVADENQPGGLDVRVIQDAAAPPLWARFYHLATDQPLFSGRDSIVRTRLADIEVERRTGYNWYVSAPRKLLQEDYPAWRARHRPGSEKVADGGNR